MKILTVFLVTTISLSSFAATAQEKLAAEPASKNKAIKAEKAFSVLEKGILLTKASFRKDAKASGNIIEIEAVNVSGGSVSLGNYASGGGAVLPPADISNITSITGNYLSTRDVSKSGRGVVMQLLDVTYPYRARLTVSDQILEFEITEPGFWKVNLAVSQ